MKRPVFKYSELRRKHFYALMVVLFCSIKYILDVLQSELAMRQPCSDTHSCLHRPDPDPVLDLDPLEGCGCDVALGAGTESASSKKAVSELLRINSDIVNSIIALHKLMFSDCIFSGYIE